MDCGIWAWFSGSTDVRYVAVTVSSMTPLRESQMVHRNWAISSIFFFQRLQGNAVLHQLTGLHGQPRGGIPRIQTYRGPRTHPLCRGTRAHPGYVGLALRPYPLTPRENVPRSAPLMITNPTIELAAGIKVVHEMPLVVQCGIVRIIVADSLRWKMLPTFVPGHTHCRGQHSILITPRATRKG